MLHNNLRSNVTLVQVINLPSQVGIWVVHIFSYASHNELEDRVQANYDKGRFHIFIHCCYHLLHCAKISTPDGLHLLFITRLPRHNKQQFLNEIN